jgi:hypothetical protein
VERRQGSGGYGKEIASDLRAREQRGEAEQLVRTLVKEAGDRGIHIDLLRSAFVAQTGGAA